MEKLGGYEFGEEVLIAGKHGYALDGSTGLLKVDGGWLKMELLAQEVERRRPSPPASSDLAAPVASTPTAPVPAPARDEGAGAEADPGDARTLFIDHDSEGNRFKEWRQVALESKYFAYSDWSLEGPATVSHLIRHTQKYGETPDCGFRYGHAKSR